MNQRSHGLCVFPPSLSFLLWCCARALMIRFIIDSIRKEAPGLEIVYRPHPLINGPKVICRLEDIEGVTLQFSSDISLDDALDQAAFVVAISSTALVQVKRGGEKKTGRDGDGFVCGSHS